MRRKKKIILLAGPTASGKSRLALELAKNLNGAIINADSMQIYKELFIITSRPKLKDINIAKHHLYGFSSVRRKFSTGRWLKIVIKKIKECWSQNQTPIVVGGTGLYFKVLTDGLAEIPDIPKNIRKNVNSISKITI